MQTGKVDKRNLFYNFFNKSFTDGIKIVENF